MERSMQKLKTFLHLQALKVHIELFIAGEKKIHKLTERSLKSLLQVLTSSYGVVERQFSQQQV